MNKEQREREKSNNLYRAKSAYVGNAFEFGFFIGLANQREIPTYKGVVINEPPYQDRGIEEDLKEYLEEITNIEFNQLKTILIKKSSKNQALPLIENYHNRVQRERTKQKEISAVDNLVMEDTKTTSNALRIIKAGYQCALANIKFIKQKWKHEISQLEILVEPTLIQKNPDFVIIKNPQKKGEKRKEILRRDSIDQPQIIAIGDMKSYYYFVNISRESLVSEYIDQLIIDEISIHQLDKFNLDKEKEVSFSDFRNIWNLLMKYLKILNYCELYLSNNISDNGPLLMFVVFPSAISSLEIKSIEHLKELKEFFKMLIPKRIRSYDDTPIELDEDDRSYLFDLLYTNQVFIKKEPNLEDNFATYSFSGKGKREVDYIFKKSEVKFVEKYKQKINSKPEQIHETIISNNIAELRNKHEQEFLEILRKDDSHVIFNGSEQGIGKNHTFIEFMKGLFKKQGNLKVVFICPRAITIRQTMEKIEKGIESSSNIKVNIASTFSKRDVQLLLDRTYKEIEVLYEKACDKFAQELRKKGNGIIFVTSQALTTFLRNSSNKLLLFSKSRYLFFDELIASSPLARQTFIDLLNYTRGIIKSRESLVPPKIIVMDASLTSQYLLANTLSSLIEKKTKWYHPFTCTYRDEKSKTERWNIDNLNIYYLKHNVEFSIEYFALSQIVSTQFINSNSFLELIPYFEMCVRESSLVKEFATFLKNGEVIFYVDNKRMVDLIVEMLKDNGYEATAITADTPQYCGKINENVVGTSSLAFGANFSHQKIIIVLPPSISNSQYFKTTRNIELFRQIVKRMRGNEEESSVSKLVIFTSLLHPNSLPNNQQISFYVLRNFIRNHLVNKKYHVLPSFSRSKYTQFGSRLSIYGSKGKILNQIRSVPLEELLKEYLPAIKNALNYFNMFLSLEYLLEFETANQLENIPSPLFLFYKITKKQLARNFKINITFNKNAKFQNIVNYLISPKQLYSVNKGLQYLEMIVKTKYYNLKSSNESIEYPYLLAFLRNGKENIGSLRYRLEKLLAPTSIEASNSFILSAIVLTEELRASDDIDKENLRKLYSIGSPFGSVYFGDMKLFEEPMRVIIQAEDFSTFTYGYIISYPKFKEFNPKIEIMLEEALGLELVRENTIILPKIVKYLLA
jgi:hypothetical protein